MSVQENLAMQETQPSAFRFSVVDNDIGVITIDVPGERVNTLKAEFVQQIEDVLQQAQTHKLQGIVIISGKPDSFIAGADITMLDACQSEQQARSLAQKGQVTLAKIAALSIPVVAAIHGACLGGGLEQIGRAHV